MTDWPTILATNEAALWRAAYRVLNHRDDALECCQAALLDAYKYSLTHQVDDWAALLVSLATRRSIDRLRRRASRNRVLVPLDDVPEPATLMECPSQRTEASELMDRLREALVELPKKQAEVFWLNCVEQLSHEDISRQLMMTANESRVLLHRARSQLAKIFNPQQSKTRGNT